jgi:hypothetical protein
MFKPGVRKLPDPLLRRLRQAKKAVQGLSFLKAHPTPMSAAAATPARPARACTGPTLQQRRLTKGGAMRGMLGVRHVLSASEPSTPDVQALVLSFRGR